MVAMVMYQKSCLYLPFYRQEKDWFQKGVPLPRETAAHWYNYCSLEYFAPVYEALHQELLGREVIHADEVPCQVLHEEGRKATSRSYMWIYLSGTDGFRGSCFMITDLAEAVKIRLNSCLGSAGCCTVTVIPLMEGSRM